MIQTKWKIVFEYTKNTKYEKDIANWLLNDLSKNYNEFNDFIILAKNAKFYNDVINKYLENDFITNLNKNKLKKLINI